MRPPPDSPKVLDSVAFIALFMLLLFLPPVLHWWTSGSPPWYLPYLLWLGVIALLPVVHWFQGRHGL